MILKDSDLATKEKVMQALTTLAKGNVNVAAEIKAQTLTAIQNAKKTYMFLIIFGIPFLIIGLGLIMIILGFYKLSKVGNAIQALDDGWLMYLAANT